MFPRNSHSNYVEKLSGGERKRLQLLLILMKNPNFLILDEPTNDLDVFTLSALEEYLLQYPGCLVIVSHDRYFLDKLVDHVFVLNGKGDVADILGNYDAYRKWEEQNKDNNKLKKTTDKPEAKPQGKSKQGKLGFKEKFELEKLEKDIPLWEQKKEMLEKKLSESLSDHEALMSITRQLAETSSQLDEMSMHWLELSELL